jgi:molybdenum cofactor biosynthesis protein MoaC
MVDVSGKPVTQREATASGEIIMQPETVRLLEQERLPKGSVLTTAKIAGIQAAKKTAHLVPLCHQLNLSWVDIAFDVREDRIGIRATVRTRESTGVEMEALTAVSVAALTIYDMCKAVDKSMEISGIRVDRKSGGRHEVTADYRPRTTILVMSDSVSSGRSADLSGKILMEGLETAGCRIEGMTIIPDERSEISSVIDRWVAEGIELIVTSGGTGLGPRDVTIDVLQQKFTRRLPGVEQALFQWGQGKIRTAMLSRLAAGIIDRTIVIVLPGSPGAAKDALEVLVPGIFHAFSMLRGEGH